MHIHCLQHEAEEGPGLIGQWAQNHGHPLRAHHLYRGDAVPTLRPGEALVIMGGSMSVHDGDVYPWLEAERALIRQQVASGERVLGICLGAQQIAHALGAPVTRNPQRELGWFPVDWAPAARREGPFSGFPRSLTVLHWHGETFGIPPGSTWAASSPACAHQAFHLGPRVIGLQFHLEATAESAAAMAQAFAQEFTETGRYIQTPEQLLEETPRWQPACQEALFRLLDRWGA